MKIALGTVQFGLDYGAFNNAGQVSLEAAAEIIDFAESEAVRVIDTARAYGESEQILGTLGAAGRFHIVTKIPSLTNEKDKPEAVAQSVAESCAALRTARLDTVMFHDASNLMGPDAKPVWKAICQQRDAGRIGRIGVSVYDGETAKKIAKDFPVSVVQLPVSIFDQRSLVDGSLDWLNCQRIEVHARSIFLQGFALADPEALAPRLQSFAPLLASFQKCAKDHSLSPLAAAVKFVDNLDSVHQIVVGIQSKKEIAEIIKAAHVDKYIQSAREFACNDPRLILPSNWN